MTADFAAVVLAGGRARRLGGVDKVLLPVGGRSLLQRTLDVLRGAVPLVVVGPQREVDAPVHWTGEEPPGGGPLAGVRAGLQLVPEGSALVAVLAADHPHLTEATVPRLRAAVLAAPRAGGAVLVDAAGERQWLLGVWRADRLRAAMPEQVRDRPVRGTFAALDPVEVAPVGAEPADVDTPEDLLRARNRA
ncbi:molybdenum cofactor guanylyltransferase [Saccharopolyspora montiporae]|uniref:molybdenum cofactor guanylyltransferase n=1 Tax=Saccharopolyspora montiporae TaxID=2781240 RepID=UPI00351C8035